MSGLTGCAELISDNTLRFVRTVPVATHAVWPFVSDPAGIERWFTAAEVDLRDGGRFEFAGGWGGYLADIDPGRCISFMADAGGMTRFEIAQEVAGSRLTLTDRMGPGVTAPVGVRGVSIDGCQPGGPGTHWAGVVAGWHQGLDALCRQLGALVPESGRSLSRYYAEYLECWFGADAAQDEAP